MARQTWTTTDIRFAAYLDARRIARLVGIRPSRRHQQRAAFTFDDRKACAGARHAFYHENAPGLDEATLLNAVRNLQAQADDVLENEEDEDEPDPLRLARVVKGIDATRRLNV